MRNKKKDPESVIGKTFKNWKVKSFTYRMMSSGRTVVYNCECLKCGRDYQLFATNLFRPDISFMCMDCSREKLRKTIKIGTRFGNRVVLRQLESKDYNNGYKDIKIQQYEVYCLVCGNILTMVKSVLMSKRYKCCVKCTRKFKYESKIIELEVENERI